MVRDPKFLLIQNNRYTAGIDGPNLILFNLQGDLILRSKEAMLNKFEGKVEILRFPEYFQLLSAEKYAWEIYVTTERLICKNNLYKMRGAFELMDHVDNHSTLAVVEPTGTVSVNDIFHMVDKKDKELKNYTIAFQIAYTRLSSISVTKKEQKRTGEPIPAGIDMWYKDSAEAKDSQITIYPINLSFEDPYRHALHIHTESLKEKLRCTNRKKDIDSSFNKGDYNSWKSTLERLLKKPDMLAQGSGSLDSDSWDPLIFQTHPIQWLDDVFAHSIEPKDKVHVSM
ncbi:MAG: hypothetical protein GF364_13215 [Candidatus Lokiarchaeota archaeon]|nr:hypothetical protein [Candidatus Lokiarchaeota archaeon]